MPTFSRVPSQTTIPTPQKCHRHPNQLLWPFSSFDLQLKRVRNSFSAFIDSLNEPSSSSSFSRLVSRFDFALTLAGLFVTSSSFFATSTLGGAEPGAFYWAHDSTRNKHSISSHFRLDGTKEIFLLVFRLWFLLFDSLLLIIRLLLRSSKKRSQRTLPRKATSDKTNMET